jgi:SsrA-binding protein
MQTRRAENKKARFDYTIDETVEGGLALTGQEVKAMRAGQASIAGAFVRPLFSGPQKQAELWLINAHFSNTAEPDRSRKILLHRREIDRYLGKVGEKGLTLVPLTLYFKQGKIKVEVGLARGKKQYEKRETLKKRDLDREISARLKH